ncbi:ASKHA domain-containing protein [Actinomycetota bacterium]
MAETKKCLIKFLPDGRSIEVPSGYNLRQAILDIGLDIDSSCGGVGTCGKCRVKVIKGEIGSKKTRFISASDKRKGFVLSCLAKVKGDLEVEIPVRKKSRAKIAEGKYSIRTSKSYSGISTDELSSVEVKPWFLKENLQVEEPTLSYGTSDLYRIKKSIRETMGIKNPDIPIHLIRKLPDRLRRQNWRVTVIMDKENEVMIDLHSGHLDKKIYGIALDIGTTSLVMYLVDLLDGSILGVQSEYNPQIKFGEDIINRIVYSNKRGGLEKLRGVLTDTLNELIRKLLKDSSINTRDVVSVMIAGNPTMMHLFYGVPPRFIREEPYVTVGNKFSNSISREVGIKHLSNAHVYSMQGVASYLGGDITSGVLASGMHDEDELALFLDLGTNGELVVGNSDWMMGCSCSAGPAFEGGGVKCGIRAADGAIEKVSIDQKTFRCHVDVIGNCTPEGICGSGLIDIIGEMYVKGVINRKGKFNKDIGNKYLVCEERDCKYIVVPADESANGKDIFISEIDIDNLIRAKSAVYAGIRTLLEEVDLGTHDLQKVYIAGGLGRNLNIRNAVIIGMLPDISINKYHFLGNTSVTGAYLSLMSEDKYKKSIEIADHITYIELSVNMKFMDRYVAGLFLPYTDMKDFPTVEEYIYSIDK